MTKRILNIGKQTLQYKQNAHVKLFANEQKTGFRFTSLINNKNEATFLYQILTIKHWDEQ